MMYKFLVISGTLLALILLRNPSRGIRRRLMYQWRIWRNRRYWNNLQLGALVVPRLRIIVSLTTTPSRLTKIEPVLKSLSQGQTRPPDEIHLNLPTEFRKNKVFYALPDFLNKYPIKIFFVNDMGPATKIIHTLQRITDSETWILTVDDDVRYLPTTIENLEDAAFADSTSVYGYSDYALWKKWKPGQPVDFLAGYAGCIYKRGFFDEKFFDYFKYASLNTACFFHDDIVINFFLQNENVSRYRISPKDCNIKLMKKRGCLLEHAGDNQALSHGKACGMNTRVRATVAIKHLEKYNFNGPA